MPGPVRLAEEYDIVVVGGGHAGLAAGLKAALLNQSAAVLDRGPKFARSYYAPKMDNIPGYPDGVSGHELLKRQLEQLRRYDPKAVFVSPARANAVTRRPDGKYSVAFDWLAQPRTTVGRAVVLAMGVVDRMPEVGGKIDPIFPWANVALVDFCLLCDGHELPDRSVAVLGHDSYAARQALDILHFGPTQVEILTLGRPFLSGVADPEKVELTAALDAANVARIETPIVGYDGIREKRFRVKFADGTAREYDRGFSGLGWYDLNQAIPRSLGCAFDADGFVLADEDSRALAVDGRTPIPGLYVAGDLKSGWNQIPEAWATAERAVIHAYSFYLV